MATITQTIEETYLPENDSKLQQPKKFYCPPDCSCKQNSSKRPFQLTFNALGIFIALLATYMIVTTDSNLYIIFWICYSVLRRMTLKSRGHMKSD